MDKNLKSVQTRTSIYGVIITAQLIALGILLAMHVTKTSSYSTLGIAFLGLAGFIHLVSYASTKEMRIGKNTSALLALSASVSMVNLLTMIILAVSYSQLHPTNGLFVLTSLWSNLYLNSILNTLPGMLVLIALGASVLTVALKRK
jgi:protein-S-isoprenylcysteine O-methyltransferase Ste14